MNNPLVSICCSTYNHVNYIEETIEGFLIQETNFPFEIIIHDDASTDGTANIIQEYKNKYPNLIKIIIQEKNQYSKGISPAKKYVWPAARGKYIAICEGDDYWIDKNKLQKQVEFLEKNTDYGLVSTNRKNYNQNTDTFNTPKTFDEPFKTFTFNEIIIESKIATLTVLVKKKLIDNYLKLYNQHKGQLVGFDYGVWMFMAYFEKIAILNDVTAVYRILPESASHSRDIKKIWKLRKSYFNDFNFFVNYFGEKDKDLVKKAYYLRAKSHYGLAGKAGDFEFCKKTFLPIFKKNKDYLRYYLLKTAIKQRGFFSLIFTFEKINLKLKHIFN